jgi:drug/metabolite transporter (DMT)-like permease
MLVGLKFTSASVAGIITSALPAIVAILSIIFLKERLTLFTGLCILFAVLGLIIINAHSFHIGTSNHIFGDIIILISLLPEAIYYILAKLHKNKLPVFLISSLMNGINIPIFLLVAWLGHYTLITTLTIQQVLLLFTIGAGSALFYVFWFMGCKKVHGAAAGLTTAFMPIATLIIAWTFLGEKISFLQLIGMMLVILSITFNAKQTR